MRCAPELSHTIPPSAHPTATNTTPPSFACVPENMTPTNFTPKHVEYEHAYPGFTLQRPTAEAGKIETEVEVAQSEAANHVWMRTVKALETALRQSECRNEIARERIAELEDTVRRYQLLLRKVNEIA